MVQAEDAYTETKYSKMITKIFFITENCTEKLMLIKGIIKQDLDELVFLQDSILKISMK